MSPVTTTTPPRTQAAILERVIRSQYPRGDLPTIAANHGLTLDELKRLIDRAGYPDKAAMARTRGELLQQADSARQIEVPAVADAPAPGVLGPDDPTPSDTTETDPTQGDGEQATASGTLVEVDVNRLRADPDNPRDELTDIPELADSIKEVGLVQPIVARRDGPHLTVVAGHRRLAAIRYLRWDRVPCIVKDSMRSDQVLAAMLIENGQRVDLDPIEEARGFNRLKVTQQLTDAQIGVMVGRTQAHVSNRLALLTLSAAEQAELRAGNMRLVEAAHRGRLASGKVGPTGISRDWHLAPAHPLANQVKARCTRLGHKRGRSVGGMGCGACWEAVIRADERQHLHDQSAAQGQCVLCGALPNPSPQEA